MTSTQSCVKLTDLADAILLREIPDSYLQLDAMLNDVDQLIRKHSTEINNLRGNIGRFHQQPASAQTANADRKIAYTFNLGQHSTNLEALKVLRGKLGRRLNAFDEHRVIDAAKQTLSSTDFELVMKRALKPNSASNRKRPKDPHT